VAREQVTIGIMGIDQHENGAIAVSRFLREAQMEVSYAGLFNTPDTLVDKALAGEADVIGVSCHSWEFLHYLPELMRRLKDSGRDIPVVVGGSVLTPADRARLAELGVAACFGAGADAEQIVDTIRRLARPGVTRREAEAPR